MPANEPGVGVAEENNFVAKINSDGVSASDVESTANERVSMASWRQ